MPICQKFCFLFSFPVSDKIYAQLGGKHQTSLVSMYFGIYVNGVFLVTENISFNVCQIILLASKFHKPKQSKKVSKVPR